LEPLGATVESRGTSKSAVSRRFVAETRAQLETWQAALLEGSTLSRCCWTASTSASIASSWRSAWPQMDTNTRFGIWEGSTENAAVCQSLLSNLQSRGRRADRSLLVLLDGSKALSARARVIALRARDEQLGLVANDAEMNTFLIAFNSF
jgi:putative transposase